MLAACCFRRIDKKKLINLLTVIRVYIIKRSVCASLYLRIRIFIILLAKCFRAVYVDLANTDVKPLRYSPKREVGTLLLVE